MGGGPLQGKKTCAVRAHVYSLVTSDLHKKSALAVYRCRLKNLDKPLNLHQLSILDPSKWEGK